MFVPKWKLMETWENFDVVLAANFLICFVNFNTKSKPTRLNLPFEENTIIINTWKFWKLRSWSNSSHQQYWCQWQISKCLESNSSKEVWRSNYHRRSTWNWLPPQTVGILRENFFAGRQSIQWKSPKTLKPISMYIQRGMPILFRTTKIKNNAIQ